MADKNRTMSFHSSILHVASIIKNNEQKKAEETIEIEKKKRERKANYTREETDRLVDILITKKDTLENKKSGSDQWQEKKQAWEDIEKAFNRKSDRTNYRDSRTLKVKYESLKRDVKKKWASIRANRRNSDGKLPKFTNAEKKIKGMISLQMDGFCDFSLANDKSEDEDDSRDSISGASGSNTRDPDWTAVKNELIYSDSETTNFDTNNLIVAVEPQNDDEPPTKRMHLDPLVEKRSHKLYNNKDDDHEVGKLESARLQMELLREELEMKKLQRKMMEEELTHKRTMHELEQQHMLLKIEFLKNKIEPLDN